MDRFGRISERGEAELDAGKHLAWFAKDPFEDQVCRRCKSLPICMGGCNLVRFRTGKRGCVLFKHNINRWVRFMYDIKTVSARKRSGKSGTR
jgi:uncharacterized protein